MKTVFVLEVTNFKTSNPDINTVELHFHNKDHANESRKAMTKYGFKCHPVKVKHVFQSSAAANSYTKEELY